MGQCGPRWPSPPCHRCVFALGAPPPAFIRESLTRGGSGINGQWPCPSLEVDVGDKVVVHVTNKLDNETTSIHWHGILQEGSSLMDGAAYVSQCPIPPGKSFTYEFEVKHPGTYWYHAHLGAQYTDGLRGPLIVHDKNDPYDDVEDEYILTVSGKGSPPIQTAVDL